MLVGMTERPPYPSYWEADVVLRDGTTAHLRPVRPEDAEAMQAMHRKQSDESVYLRFFAPLPVIPKRDLERFVNVDYHDRVAFVMTVGGEIIGDARYDRIDERSAEVAFNVADDYQGRGLGSIFLEHLAAAARERGIREFHAEVLPQNRSMLAVFMAAGYKITRQLDDGVVAVHFNLDPTEESRRVQAAREHRAEARSVHSLLHPASVAVLGASRKRTSTGNLLLRNLKEAGFPGEIFVVHPEADQVAGFPAYRSFDDLPEQIDLGVIAVPAERCIEVVRQCAQHGVKGVVVISSGFAEEGPEGLALQQRMVATARAHGMRVVGPNSLGVINADAALNASLAPFLPPAGPIGLFAQSGAFGTAILAEATRRGLGVSSFVSAGNRADLSGNDMLQYWEEDPATKVVGLYLESVGNPRKFSRIARRLSLKKPVVVVKADFTAEERPPGHHVRSSRLSSAALIQIFEQAGVVRADTMHALFDVAQVFTSQPLPAGRRVGVIGNSAALATLVVQRLRAEGLEVTVPPVSMHPEVSTEEFRVELERMFANPDVDSVVMTFTPSSGPQSDEIAPLFAQVSARSGKTTVACFLGIIGNQEFLTAHVPGDDGEPVPVTVPAFGGPEYAAWALARATDYAMWRESDRGTTDPPAGVDLRAARRLIRRLLAGVPAGEQRTLEPGEVAALLETVGISVVPHARVHTPEEASAAAREFGFPVALKAVHHQLRHRLDAGGVQLNIDNDAELRDDFLRIQDLVRRVGGHSAGEQPSLDVQPMAPPGTACVVTAGEDPLLGPVVSFSIAGDATELLDDVAHRGAPLTNVDARAMITSVKAAPRLLGYQGTPAANLSAVADVIMRLSALVDEFPEVSEIALRPLHAGAEQVHILSAYAVLRSQPDRKDSVRRLS